MPFVDDMVAAYDWADLVVARAGALTVSELMTAARPAILIPFPYAVDDHQTANAQALVALGGGQVQQQADLSPEGLANALSEWLVPERLNHASQALRAGAPKRVTEIVAQRILKRLDQEERQ
jgi:UDP-N-acetylglucosamine--N-acetylmuramyl-(pentapeptide) pyrophosphoryl-undecaprenol N-acetylglucosamine transferase